VAQGQDVIANITVAATGNVSGTVFNMNGVPFPNLAVDLHNNAGDYTTTTDVGGNFSFFQVLPGSATLETYDPTSQSGAAAQLSVLSNQTVSQNLTLVQGTGTVTGTVTEFGTPVSGAQVTITTATGGTISTTTAADGTYSATSVPVGPVSVKAQFFALTGQVSSFLPLPGSVLTVNVPVQAPSSWNLPFWRPNANRRSVSASLVGPSATGSTRFAEVEDYLDWLPFAFRP
jgi:hypothetical protein